MSTTVPPPDVQPDLHDEPPPPGPGLERDAEKAASRRGFLIGLPGLAYLVAFFAAPLLIVVVYSFASRSPRGATVLAGWNLDSYARLTDSLVLTIAWRSLWIAVVTTLICLVLAYPFAYYLATRPVRVRALLLVLVMIPFWSNFLVRTYAWRMLLGSDGPLTRLLQTVGIDATLLFTPTGVMIGLVYGYLPFMILPLYAAVERLDHSLVEAARDLYASGWQAFWKVTWPLSRPGVIAGSILVFIPSFGAYVTPEILGGRGSTMLGSYIARQFIGTASDWPFGSALSVAILVVMLAAATAYFRAGGKNL
ncbi:ABC transporter permease [Egicoccus halophilus]|uniref:ABC transporter permease n=1 Tax=Egicoccus halophilus TaxID=1670830 RepID=A0A8J3ESY3_9ACTN|nr:ABC transporter permease [Egicoccus halophilus]GGI04066.1 ABC transporter permease [Egicoccus halophilus]